MGNHMKLQHLVYYKLRFLLNISIHTLANTSIVTLTPFLPKNYKIHKTPHHHRPSPKTPLPLNLSYLVPTHPITLHIPKGPKTPHIQSAIYEPLSRQLHILQQQ